MSHQNFWQRKQPRTLQDDFVNDGSSSDAIVSAKKKKSDPSAPKKRKLKTKKERGGDRNLVSFKLKHNGLATRSMLK